MLTFYDDLPSNGTVSEIVNFYNEKTNHGFGLIVEGIDKISVQSVQRVEATDNFLNIQTADDSDYIINLNIVSGIIIVEYTPSNDKELTVLNSNVYAVYSEEDVDFSIVYNAELVGNRSDVLNN